LGKANAAQEACAAFYYSLPDRASNSQLRGRRPNAINSPWQRGTSVHYVFRFLRSQAQKTKNDKNKKYHRASDVTEERSSADTTSYDFSTLK
jgi:hypothetical protein